MFFSIQPLEECIRVREFCKYGSATEEYILFRN